MISTQILKNSNWFTKFSINFLAFVGSVNVCLFIALPLLPFHLSKFIMPLGLISLAIAILFSVGFSIYWQVKEKKGNFNSERWHLWLTSLLRYWLALHISIFGFEKLMGINFAPSFHGNDTPAGLLNGQELTWIYYSYSYGISIVVAFFQIVGSYLLLYRKTILVGVSMLLPVMFNILLINIFYGIGPITTFTALTMVLGLSYLLYQRKQEILALFKSFENNLPSIGSRSFRNIARILCLIIPILFLVQYKTNVYASSKYFGKWKVETLKRNGKLIADDAWEKDTTAWKTIYFEERGKLLFTPNPYKYDDDTSIFMKYEYNEEKDAIKVISYEKNPERPDTIAVKINKFKGNSMEWNMIFYKDTIQMQLKKEL
ncbi:hypothetical protein EQG63_06990 [Flavobacterium amnicola]|uniref:Uncharacterized protein n=1 Tax=Flavobacterium amnicola TaxID=2506422 RepID=A0A4Q1K2L6_9FLAO|nr:hypothetical protein [Flavobacterium amnicola]RXR19185.1 hypothetical protein EQG63_06990 [Flavobacterium amnicola]